MMEVQLVVFRLAEESYGLDITAVEGIIKMQAITAIPHAGAFIEGITNLRGDVLPVIDLRKRFGLASIETSQDSYIVVVELDHGKVGVIVDDVSEVLRVSSGDVEPPSPVLTKANNGMLKSVVKMDERLILLLDIDKLFSSEEQSVLHDIPVPV